MDENEQLKIPDFSEDDFENDKEVKKWRDAEKEYEKMIDESVTLVCNAFSASTSSHKNFKGFDLHRLINLPFILETYTGTVGRKTILFSLVQYHTSMVAGRTRLSGTDEYFVGVITLERSYPHTIIQRETIALKINNLFVPGDIDFTHAKRFSSKFHVISKDEERLRRSFDNADLDRLNEFSNAEIEIRDNECYFRTGRKPASREEAEVFIELAKTISGIF